MQDGLLCHAPCTAVLQYLLERTTNVLYAQQANGRDWPRPVGRVVNNRVEAVADAGTLFFKVRCVPGRHAQMACVERWRCCSGGANVPLHAY